MSDDAERKERVRQRKLATARELEGRGFVDQAVQSFLKADAPDEAARVLRSAGRPSEAAATLLMALGVDVDGVGSLDEEKRKLAAMAADCFDAVGDKDRAGRIRAQLSGGP
ncbi:MAG: hypothetical protein K8H88_24375, partial [Sandaracinaceae bacterium]|nr:hypothetical protein [Sandaracinaceae bacterium]